MPFQTVIGDILPYTQAIAIANQTVFGTNWTANDASDVVVFLTPNGQAPNDVTQALTSSQFSVAFIGDQQQVQVTLVTPANAGDIVTTTRQTPADRMNLYTNTNFLPSMLNQDFGILTLVDQQAQLVNQRIAPRYNYSAEITEVVDTILPILGANQVWMKNSNNTAIIATTIGAAGSGNVAPGLQNQLAWYALSGTTVSGLPTGNNGVLVTSNSGVPSISSQLPTQVMDNITKLGIQTQDLNMGNFSIRNIPSILDQFGLPVMSFQSAGNAANTYITIINGNSPGAPGILATGTGSDLSINLIGKGVSGINICSQTGNDPLRLVPNLNSNIYGLSLGVPTITSNKTVNFQDSNGTVALQENLTMTLKQGSGGGNYSTTSASYVDIDGTNLSYTVTIPTGYKIQIVASINYFNNTDLAGCFFAITDGTTVLTEIGANQITASSPASSASLNYIFTGDGNSHTFKLRYKTDAGTLVVANSSSTKTPSLSFIMMPSN